VFKEALRGSAAPVEVVDLSLGIRDRGVGVRPGEADLKRRKQHAVDGDGRLIEAPDSGVPQILSSLEGLDLKAGVIHVAPPLISASQRKHAAAKTNVNSFTSPAHFLPAIRPETARNTGAKNAAGRPDRKNSVCAATVGKAESVRRFE
jgi:hypothetical protein